MVSKVKPVPEGYNTVTPYLIVDNAAAAIEFYKNGFGAMELFRIPAPGDKVGHAEIRIGNSVVMLADEHPEVGARGPRSVGGSPVSIVVYVDDVDSVAERLESAGAKVVRPVENQFYGDRAGTFEDPFGHQWHVHTHVEDVSPDEMQKRAASMGG